jgi:uncharacterized repeat protein (TIGR03803 family)
MSGTKAFTILLSTVFLGSFLTTAVSALAATQEQIVYSFCSVSGCPDGGTPWFAGVTVDSLGNLYGTTLDGGTNGEGTVFELSPSSNGTWTQTVLYSFCSISECVDGAVPGGGVILDAQGNLYGTTGGGGSAGSDCGSLGCGTVFELTPGMNGTWTERVLHSFNGKDGYDPFSPLVFDKTGNLYGTTSSDGRYNGGTAFELIKGENGTWKTKVLHNFHDNGPDGSAPQGALILDAAGNLYGTTFLGGTGNCGCGTVFQLTLGKKGIWTEKVLHSFAWGDGANPDAGVVLDHKGNLYGTTLKGGGHYGCFASGCGTVFELVRGKQGVWKRKLLHTFKNDGADGCKPYAPVIFDESGNLYGTTAFGGPLGCNGSSYGSGTVFQLVPFANGKWAETVLYSFKNDGTDGQQPLGGLSLDAKGSLFGTTYLGGTNLDGIVFKIRP